MDLRQTFDMIKINDETNTTDNTDMIEITEVQISDGTEGVRFENMIDPNKAVVNDQPDDFLVSMRQRVKDMTIVDMIDETNFSLTRPYIMPLKCDICKIWPHCCMSTCSNCRRVFCFRCVADSQNLLRQRNICIECDLASKWSVSQLIENVKLCDFCNLNIDNLVKPRKCKSCRLRFCFRCQSECLTACKRSRRHCYNCHNVNLNWTHSVSDAQTLKSTNHFL